MFWVFSPTSAPPPPKPTPAPSRRVLATVCSNFAHRSDRLQSSTGRRALLGCEPIRQVLFATAMLTSRARPCCPRHPLSAGLRSCRQRLRQVGLALRRLH